MPKRKGTYSNDASSQKRVREDGNKDNEDAKPSNDGEQECGSLKTVTVDGRKSSLKIVSWNCAGLRAMVKKGGLDYLKEEDADIVCFQETKCTEKECPPEVNTFKKGLNTIVQNSSKPKYQMYYLSAEKKGYSGTALWTKTKPQKITYGLGIKKHDSEGRLITAEYEKFYLVTSYVPNSGKGLVKLDYRMTWEDEMKKYLKKLEETKPVIYCGDLNVAHNEIDIARPKNNVKNPGFTKEERQRFSELLDAGFVDSYRHLYPQTEGTYTFWSYLGKARAENIGWELYWGKAMVAYTKPQQRKKEESERLRGGKDQIKFIGLRFEDGKRLDYFVLSKSLISDLCDSTTRPAVKGSDHCPVVLTMAL